ncbi:RNA recognition motif domain [Dillenia turbinata]|uniref:RNA recognition motif domain n=1 Tax=Dillenia turbinata TaxID=194707 RepID=A0AAN8Z0P2_9MAGN
MMNSNGGDSNNQNQQQQQQQYHLHQQQQQHLPQWQQQQQQWMAMQYPAAAAAAMVMHQQHFFSPHPNYLPYANYYQIQQQQQQHQQQSQSQITNGSTEENKTIWVGDLHYWMDESFLHNCFSATGEVSTIKVIRNKQTGQSEGYGFVEFLSHTAAENVLQSYNGTLMPNTDQPFRLNWATFSGNEKRAESGSDSSIFVGDLASDVTDTILMETFSSRYPSVKGAKVIFDQNSGRSKGYGFVRFGDENEKSRAMTEMNGMYCSSRPMRIGVATPKKASGYSSQAVVLAGGNASNGALTQRSQSDNDLTNTTIYVGGLDSSAVDEDLREPFSQFGEVVSIKIPAGKGCGFVQFANRTDAEAALQNLNGTVIGKQTVRLSWGRTPANKQLKVDPTNQWSGAYYGGQGYNAYGYGFPTNHDPSMYGAAAAYGAS